MKNSKISDCKVINLQTFINGEIKFYDPTLTINDKFKTSRVYYLYNLYGNKSRGFHGHKNLKQLIIPLQGSFEIVLKDGKNSISIFLDSNNVGIHIVPGIWRELRNFSKNAICLVLASDLYDEEDYIRDYNEFLIYKTKS